ncbi:PAAR domain-containing protein [Pseudomonas sp. QL9]|uniref:PAAR domain-containing protein n=1 Tax=Pseudomonas sp. QL9 TaxID=3242725 RepID=UPI003529FCB6
MKPEAFDSPYNNEASIDLLQKLNTPQFTDNEISTFSPEIAVAVRSNQTDLASNPVVAIRRMAAEGSQSKLGGTILKGSSGLTITLRNGTKVTVATVGDRVKYPNGKTARITTGAGRENFNVALVGSRLENGDEIVNTPQDVALITIRQHTLLEGDFLPGSADE